MVFKMTSDLSVLKTKEVVPEVKAVLAQTICIEQRWTASQWCFFFGFSFLGIFPVGKCAVLI